MAASLIEAMNQILTLQTTLIWYINSMQEKAEAISSIKVTRFQLSDLRSDLIERARMMTTSRTANHPWKSMSDEELLRSAGLILKDEEKQIEGITLAAILLFWKRCHHYVCSSTA